MTLARLAHQLNSRNAASISGARVLPPLLLMTDPARLPDPCAAAERLPRGSGVILRAYEAAERDRLAHALVDITRRRGLVLLIAVDAALAAEIGADGIHLPEALSGQARALRRRPDWLVTVAAHSLAALHSAARAGADAALLSPVFATASHPEMAPLGPHQFAALVRRARLPVYALGGITKANAPLLHASGAVGIAGISALSGRA
ncbi:MAG: thiamine monophosphate synthase [Alphaproteobacteria bacterium]|nr:thiamine monophosphate synthase [Alphaproteobacteria bacterium]